jgi:hypothetical protein
MQGSASPPVEGWWLKECPCPLRAGVPDPRRCAVTTSRNADHRTPTDGGDRAKADVRRLSDNPLFRTAARLGFATSGLLQLLVGVIAVEVALHGGGQQSDQSGAFGDIAKTPGGAIVLWIGVVGSFALALWFVVQAFLRREPEAKDRWKEGAKDLGKAVVYAVIGFTALQFALGGSSDSASSQRKGTATLLDLPGGSVLVALLGVVVIVIGGFLAYRGWSKKFTEELVLPAGAAGRATLRLGQVGYIARGVAVVMVGILFVVAAFTADAKKAGGLDGALKAFADLPFGKIVLLVIALGWIASGIYTLVRARRARMR